MDRKAKIATVASLLVAIAVLALVVLAAPKKCNNGVDDDNDGLVDFPADPGCSGMGDNSETSSALVCDNGLDETNDADTLADYRLSGGDPGCTSAIDGSEVDGQCDDLADNDNDTHIDVNPTTGDSKCTGTTDNDESPRDFCSDTDGGLNRNVQGTVSGEDSSVPFSNTDFCINSTHVNEYSCGGKANDYDSLSSALSCLNATSCVNGACV